jgi:hypothetical protein
MEKWLNDCISSRRAECWPGREGLAARYHAAQAPAQLRLGRQPLDPTQAIFGTTGGPILAAAGPPVAAHWVADRQSGPLFATVLKNSGNSIYLASAEGRFSSASA